MDIDFLGKEWKDDVRGATLDQRIIDQCLKANSKRASKGNILTENVLCFITDKKNEIKELGLNKPNDLMTNNFGNFLAGFFTYARNTARTSYAVMKEVDGSSLSLPVWITATSDFPIQASHIRVGSGSTAPARTDYKIETPFTTSCEADYATTSEGSFFNTQMATIVSLACGGSGTIRETGMFFRMQYTSSFQYYFLMFHDALAPEVTFTAGQTAHVVYGVVL